MASELPPKFDDADRAITPMESFDSRPKLQIAEAVAGVTRLRPLSNLGQADHEIRDTDHDELTPAERPFEIRVMERLTKLEESDRKRGEDLTIIKKSSRKAAQLSIETNELVKAIDRRQRAYDLERRWVPYVALLVIGAIAVLALIRTFR